MNVYRTRGVAVVLTVILCVNSLWAEDKTPPQAQAAPVPASAEAADLVKTRDVVIEENHLTKNNADLIAKAQALKDAGKLTLDMKKTAAALAKPTPAVLTLPPVSQKRLEPEAIASIGQKALIRVGWLNMCQTCSRWHISLAGGYPIAEDGVVVTCHHVVSPDEKTMSEGYLVASDTDGHVFPVTGILAADEDMDVAIIRIDAQHLNALPINTQRQPGSAAYLFSDPLGVTGYFSVGIVNRYYWEKASGHTEANTLEAARHLRMHVSTDWGPGSSGAAVLDGCGNAIGHVAVITPLGYDDEGGRTSGFTKDTDQDEGHGHQPDQKTIIVLHEAIPARGVKLLVDSMQQPQATPAPVSADAATAETVKDADGNIYHTVKIGNQVWTVENLRTTKFNDDTPIPNVTDDAEWKSLTTPGFCYYENNPDHGKKYGALYNWYAASSDKIAPKGWRVPTHEEQIALQQYLIANGYNYDGTQDGSADGNKIAKSMTAQTGWDSDPVPGNAGHDQATNNRTGFSALPTGSRWNDGSFHSIGRSAYWWSSTPGSGDDAHLSSIKTGSAQYGFNQHHKRSGFCIRLVRDAAGPEPDSQSAAGIDLKANGAFGFPQDKARVLCDTPQLRLSVANNDDYLFVQAVMWNDHSDEPSETEDGRTIGNCSELNVDVDANGKVTPEKDRSYSLNPWPHLPGLHYCILLDEESSTTLQSDSMGRGSLEYVTVRSGKPVRVDNYLIPLAEIGRKPGDRIRLAFEGQKVKQKLTVKFPSQSQEEGQNVKPIHEYTLLENGPAIHTDGVPEGRRPAAVKETRPAPTMGSEAPEVVAKKWFNWTEKDQPSLKNLRGKVVLVEFWATWCSPCLAGVPHLNELHENFSKDGLVILSVAEQSLTAIEKYVNSKKMKYTVGAETEAFGVYGVNGIPQAFLIDRNGKIAWAGSPSDEEMELKLKDLLNPKPTTK